jgi:hypothetical protein
MATRTTEHPEPEPAADAALLPTFALATVVATIVIAAAVAYPSTVATIVALATVIVFAGGLVALLGRVIGPDGQ